MGVCVCTTARVCVCMCVCVFACSSRLVLFTYQIHKSIALAPNHSLAFVSLRRRMKEIESLLETRPALLLSLARDLDKSRSPALVLSHLGLSSHPSTVHITDRRDPMHGKIVYHADSFTLYTMQPPPVLPADHGEGPPPAPPPLPPPPADPADDEGPEPPPLPPPRADPDSDDGPELPDDSPPQQPGRVSAQPGHQRGSAPGLSSSSSSGSKSQQQKQQQHQQQQLEQQQHGHALDSAWTRFRKTHALKALGTIGKDSKGKVLSAKLSTLSIQTMFEVLKPASHQQPPSFLALDDEIVRSLPSASGLQDKVVSDDVPAAYAESVSDTMFFDVVSSRAAAVVRPHGVSEGEFYPQIGASQCEKFWNLTLQTNLVL